MKKISLMNGIKKVFLMIIFLLASSLVTVSAASYPSKITVGRLTWLDDYLGYEVDFNYKQTSDGKIIYCLEYPKDVPTQGMELTYSSVADAGLTYIIKNGYPNKKFTGDNNKDYFVTQVAVWLYLNQSTTGLNLIKQDMASESGIMYTALNNLVDGANKAKSAGYGTSSLKLNISTNKLTLSNDGKYYVSKEFGVSSSNISGNYKVTLTNAPTGTLIQTTDGKNNFEFSQNSKFVIKVPVESINSLSTSFTINVNATGSIDKTYIYTTGKSNYQKMVLAALYPVTNALSDNGNVTITTDKVVINKTDSETGKNIAGATLAIKNEKGTKVAEWVTTTNSKVIMNLPAGKYTLYEVKAPTGYEKTNKTYSFTIANEGKENKINVPNVELVHTAQVEISKQDVTTSKELPGAKLTIKDSKGKVVETWVSTDKPHYLTLEVGKYTLIEEIAPEGYILSKEEITFEITKSTKDVVKKVMYNTPEPIPEPEPEPTPEPVPEPEPEPEEEIVEVPKTDVNSTILYTITASISALGYGLMKKFGRR